MNERKIQFKNICPDCKEEKGNIIRHHIVDKKLANYLIEIGHFSSQAVYNLRRQLYVSICKECEEKFHNGEFYNNSVRKIYEEKQ